MPDGVTHVFPSYEKSSSLQERFEKDYTKDDKIQSTRHRLSPGGGYVCSVSGKGKNIAMPGPGLK
jgi:hypothetical protein